MPSNPNSSESRATLLAKQIKRDWWWITFGLIIFTAIFSLLKERTSLHKLDLTFYDFQYSHLVPLPPETSSALIIIDDRSINQIGYWPWRRAEYARALDYLGLAKAVGLDIIFSDKNPSYLQDDDFLAYSIEEHGRVVLPSVIDIKNEYENYPIAELARAASNIGYINAYPDRDGVVRRTHPYQLLPIGLTQHFSLAMIYAGGDEEKVDYIYKDPPSKSRLIPFIGPPGSFNTYSFTDVVNGRYSPDEFKDKYVFIGAWSQGLGDFYPTPLSTLKQTSMSGVEILANNLENILHNKWVNVFPTPINALLSTLPVLLTCIILRRLTPRRALLSTAAVVVVTLVGNWIALSCFKIWIPPTSSLLGTILAYPVWYWRSQETVLRFINNEINQMRNHDPVLRQSLNTGSTDYTLPERLSHLHRAIELLREAQQRREETLRFISHDMRAPQNSILALVKMTRDNQLLLDLTTMLDKIESYASTTLELVDDFMDLARVEAMEMTLEPLFLNDLLATVCDDAWIRAKSKNINLVFIEPEDGIWVSAHPPLLKRALINLIDNAIKYSPENTTVECLLTLNTSFAQITISDQGWGIPAENLSTIFQPFKRAHTFKPNAPSGSGLGLAFVQMVILRHFSTIQVQSKESIGTAFTIKIPISTEPV